MQHRTPSRRPLVAGVRPAGQRLFRLVIHGNAQSAFPPLRAQMSLRELAQWLQQTQAPLPAAGRQLPLLRVVD